MILQNVFINFKKRKSIIGKFRAQAAGSVELARSLNDLKIDYKTNYTEINKLSRKGILKKFPSDNLYYLDERQLLQVNMNLVKWGIIFLFLILGFIFLILSKPAV